MLTLEWQARLDAMAYPPTHEYRVDTMTPIGSLARRSSIVQSFIDRCERRASALEVGFNKGYFLHLLGRSFAAVDGCEPWTEYFQLVDEMRTELAWPNVRNLHHGGLETLPDPVDGVAYDFIFLGNCMHHVFRDVGDYSFIARLAKLCRGSLLIEGFTSLEGDDEFMKGARRKWPADLQRRMTDEAFEAAIAPHFRRIDSQHSPTGPDRRFMYFERIHSDEGDAA